MNNNIIKFYITANKLKNVIRTGWKEVKISADRLESVAEHVYGSLVLAITIDSEYKLNLDMLKVLKMITINELSKVNLDSESTPINPVSKEDRINNAKRIISEITEGLVNKDELLDLLDEYNSLETNEAKFARNICKLESDLQAKIYDLNGEFNLENAIEDAKNYPKDLADKIVTQMKKASDGWILFDRQYYENEEIFTKLSEDIENL